MRSLPLVLLLACGGDGADKDTGPADTDVGDTDADHTGTPSHTDTDGDTDTDTDEGTDTPTADTAPPVDTSPAPAPLAATTWTRTFQGIRLGTGPFSAIAPDGDVFVGFEGGPDFADTTVLLGEGEAHETLLDGYFMPAVAWYDGTTGDLQAARSVAELVDSSDRGSPDIRTVAVDATGQGYALGDFCCEMTFHAGTPAARALRTEYVTIGSSFHRAEDVWVSTWDDDLSPGWVTRGTTPGPISRTWFNYGTSMTVLSGGDLLVYGQMDGGGVTFGTGTPGAHTFGRAGTFLARLTPAGTPVWVHENTSGLRAFPPSDLQPTPDGGAMLLIGYTGTTTVNVGVDDLVLPGATSPVTGVLLKYAADGTLDWHLRTVGTTSWELRGHAVRDDGSIALWVNTTTGLEVLDAAGAVVASFTPPTAQSAVLSLAADGSFQWLAPLDVDWSPGVGFVADEDGRVWLTARLDGGRATIPLDTGDLAWPVPVQSGDLPLFLVGVSSSGVVDRAELLGLGLWPDALSVGPGPVLMVGGSFGPHVVPPPSLVDGGALAPLPLCEEDHGYRAWLAHVAL